eukprot:m.161289 g.161289  ORF g.161289 m.161289 type:complete len:161 (+) comp23833_c0_seq1:1644-2126(+)
MLLMLDRVASWCLDRLQNYSSEDARRCTCPGSIQSFAGWLRVARLHFSISLHSVASTIDRLLPPSLDAAEYGGKSGDSLDGPFDHPCSLTILKDGNYRPDLASNSVSTTSKTAGSTFGFAVACNKVYFGQDMPVAVGTSGHLVVSDYDNRRLRWTPIVDY